MSPQEHTGSEARANMASSSDTSGDATVIAALCAFFAAAHQRTDLILEMILRVVRGRAYQHPLCRGEMPHVCTPELMLKIGYKFRNFPMFEHACRVGGATLFRGCGIFPPAVWEAGEDYVLCAARTIGGNQSGELKGALLRRYSRVVQMIEDTSEGIEDVCRVTRAYLKGEVDDDAHMTSGFMYGNPSAQGPSALEALMAGGHVDRALKYLMQSAERINEHFDKGPTPLECALRYGCGDIVRALLADARLDLGDAVDYKRVVHVAILGGTMALLLNCPRTEWSFATMAFALTRAFSDNNLDVLRALLASPHATPVLEDGTFLLDGVTLSGGHSASLRILLDDPRLRVARNERGHNVLDVVARTPTSRPLFNMLLEDARIIADMSKKHKRAAMAQMDDTDRMWQLGIIIKRGDKVLTPADEGWHEYEVVSGVPGGISYVHAPESKHEPKMKTAVVLDVVK